MSDWWADLLPLNRFLYGMATVCGVLFIWQLVMAFLGFGGDEVEAGGAADAADAADGADGADAQAMDVDQADHPADMAESVASFKLLSVRSVISFFTLFSWGSAMYMDGGMAPARALFYGVLWGLAGMVTVALAFYGLQRLSHSGNRRIRSCVGSSATVYLNIPRNGTGQVRATVDGVVSYIKARSADGHALKAGKVVRITRALDANSVEVQPITES